MTGDPAALYLRDLGPLIKELALRARAERDAATGDDRPFAEGRLLALHEVVSLMQQQADAFQLERASLGLDDVEPERDLI
jgi:hypothetical protein